MQGRHAGSSAGGHGPERRAHAASGAPASPGLLSLRGATRSWPTALGPDGAAFYIYVKAALGTLEVFKTAGHWFGVPASLWCLLVWCQGLIRPTSSYSTTGLADCLRPDAVLANTAKRSFNVEIERAQKAYAYVGEASSPCRFLSSARMPGWAKGQAIQPSNTSQLSGNHQLMPACQRRNRHLPAQVLSWCK
jgi:hypothetical protein